ncbi:cysteine desulfurase family protein [Hydrogenibacillus schlegelii]|uniref:Cysteine desulfurase n=1 Tax=Hydrogenibacillus schlegelii TaxID=1484 RepID=A0A132N632_HYDSH|nr:cysteine desulfurase family protein [Hydrogenibacillus schlegelii]KWX05621.1 hypothetical protein TR75_07675 [Hydrogenibacillus schlegelii]MBT9282393.1 cysteine desulfurase [Hydrogenibacillus schlegelii]OAR05518.1 hypothetical protein SA87_11570 [Hydrogenibacillus schlegelii]PTQ54037.1 MAG: Cysteine desulfurase [Hydrogenibacillus schlegelii]
MRTIYLDHAATTPLIPEVRAALAALWEEPLGNPSSAHALGRAARRRLEAAREDVAALTGTEPRGWVFTSGATESVHLALFGVALSARGGEEKRRRIVVSAVEHAAVRENIPRLRALGFDVVTVPVDAGGHIDPEAFRAAVDDGTLMVSLIYGQNEVGTLQDVRSLGAWARSKGAIIHLDAVQVPASWPFAPAELPADLITLSAHKLGGPVGAGALYVRPGTPVEPLFAGGRQERGLRSGTENVAGAVGFATALAVSVREAPVRRERYEAFRERLLSRLRESGLPFRENGAPPRLPHIVNVTFPGVAADVLLMRLDLDGVCASAGSACATGAARPSPVLLAMGRTPEEARSSIRLSFGPGLAEADIDEAAERLVRAVRSFLHADRSAR